MVRQLVLLLLLIAGAVRAEVVNISEGTNLSLAIHPANEFIAIDLLGGLWRLPVTGGGATALIPAGSGVANPRFDPAGERIVFQRWLDGQWDIWSLTVATGRYAPLTETEFNEREPDVSQDGERVVFAADRSGIYELWSQDLATGALRQLTDEPGNARYPTFGGANELAYVNVRDTRSEIRLYGGGPRGQTLIDTGRRIDAPSWRPGAGVLVVNERSAGRGNDLWLHIDADEPVTRRLTEEEDVFVGRAGWISPEEYVYAADGAIWRRRIGSLERTRILLFAGINVDEIAADVVDQPLDREGPHPIVGINGLVHNEASGLTAFTALGDLWLVDDGEIVRLTDDQATDAWPDFSPDGDWLVFASDRGGRMDLWRYRISSGQLLRVSDDPGRSFGPRVSADGRFVAFLESADNAPWSDAAVKLIDFDHPFQPVTLATGLYDAGDLDWQGSYLRVPARDAPGAERYPHVFETEAAEEPLPAVSRPDLAAELANRPELRWQPPGSDAPYVIQAARLFDGISGEYQYHVDIHVDGQRITDVVRRDRLPLPDRVIDFRESTVVPGLIDVHAHLATIAGSDAGKQWLRYGVTTVRDVTTDWLGALERAETWASGQQPGPRVVVAPVDAATAAIRDSPIVVSPGLRILGGGVHAIADQWARDVGDLRGLPPVPLITASPGIPWLAFSTAGRSYEDVLARIRASRVYFSTGLGALAAAQLAGDIEPVTAAFERIMRASGRIAIGSDAPGVSYGAGFHDELAILARTGMPNDQILRYATASGAVALGLSLQLGTLEAGRLADLVVVDGDPLSDLRDLQRIQAVIQGGVLHDAALLRQND
jgi:dipeptidyl aminopeptidase/acylaminoacyl peptidase